jgi:Cu/Zn superoxide dismutase
VRFGLWDNQYTPNDAAAPELTAGTGNAGARIACGVIVAD